MKKALKIGMNILKWTVIAALALVLVFNVYTLISRAVTGDDITMTFGVGSAVVRSGSMSGTIEVGDMVIIRNTGDYQTGDIITYKSGSSYTTHRIIGVTDEGYLTKGDANNTSDQDAGLSVVSKDSVKGEVVGVIPSVGTVTDFIRTPLGIIIILAVLALIIALPYVTEGIAKLAEKKSDRGNDNGNNVNTENNVEQG